MNKICVQTLKDPVSRKEITTNITSKIFKTTLKKELVGGFNPSEKY